MSDQWVEIEGAGYDPSHEYSDDCPGCQPAILDMRTGKPLPQDGPVMKAVIEAFHTKTTLAQRLRWHRVVIQNSRDPEDLRIAGEVARVLEEAMENIIERGR